MPERKKKIVGTETQIEISRAKVVQGIHDMYIEPNGAALEACLRKHERDDDDGKDEDHKRVECNLTYA